MTHPYGSPGDRVGGTPGTPGQHQGSPDTYAHAGHAYGGSAYGGSAYGGHAYGGGAGTATAAPDPWAAPPGGPTPPPPAGTGPERPRRVRGLAATAAVALVGALVGGGVVAVATDDGTPTASTSGSTATGQNAQGSGPSNATTPSGMNVGQVLSTVEPAVVTVRTQAPSVDSFLSPEPQQGTGTGTGFVIAEDGVIVTNNHVVDGAGQVSVTMSDGKTYEAEVLGTDPSHDMAVLDVEAQGLPTVELGDSNALRVGDPVVAIGNALALPGGPTVTDGIVSALNRTISADGSTQLTGLVQTDAAISPGNSGGPLVDAQGRVVGINTAVAAQGENIGFAIAVSDVRNVINQLRDGETVQQAYLGVQMTDVTPAVQQQFDLSVDRGALVMGVESGSPADGAGLQQGDVVTRVDGKSVTSASDLSARIQAQDPKDSVTLTVARGGQEQQLDATLTGRTVGGPGQN